LEITLYRQIMQEIFLIRENFLRLVMIAKNSFCHNINHSNHFLIKGGESFANY